MGVDFTLTYENSPQILGINLEKTDAGKNVYYVYENDEFGRVVWVCGYMNFDEAVSVAQERYNSLIDDSSLIRRKKK